jgi:phosphate transport system substrate-binding protein
VITHPTAPFGEISVPVLREVFRGRVQEWGGLVLVVVSREEGSGTRTAFENLVLGDDEAASTAVVVASSGAVVEYVSETPASIGYVSTLTLVQGGSEGVRVLPVDGVSPVPKAIADGEYVLSRTLLLATIGEPTGEAREFAMWVLGAAGQVTISRHGTW